MDLLQREGLYPVPPQTPKTLGVEFSGIVESFGKDAEKGFSVGDEVFGLAYGGSSENLNEQERFELRSTRRLCGVYCCFYAYAPPQAEGAILGTGGGRA